METCQTRLHWCWLHEQQFQKGVAKLQQTVTCLHLPPPLPFWFGDRQHLDLFHLRKSSLTRSQESVGLKGLEQNASTATV